MLPDHQTTATEAAAAARADETQTTAGVLASLAVSQFRWLLTSNTTFFLGMGGQQVLRAWLVYRLTASELALGLISAAVAVPMLLVAPLGGVVADRFDRRNLVAAGQATAFLGELVMLMLLLSGRLRYWHLVSMAGIMGSVFPFIMPARQAIVANVVGRRRLTNAMALNMAAVEATRVLGPAAAGLLIGAFGVAVAYTVNVALYLSALLCLTRVHSAPPSHEGARVSLARNMREGFRYLLEHRLVLVLLLFGLTPMFLILPFQSLLVVFAEDVWQVGAQGLGLLSAAVGTGGVSGAVLVAWHSRATRRLRAMMASMVGLGVFLVVFTASPWYLLALPAIFVAGLFANFFTALNNTAIQVLIPDEVRGRVSSFLMMSFSLPLLGTLPLSAVAEVYGADRAVAGAAVLAVLIAFLFYAASAELRKMDARVAASLSS
jgi:MFS family permease